MITALDLVVVENFKDLVFPGVKPGIYKIDENGNIWSKKKSGLMIPQKDKDGYLRIKLSGGDKDHSIRVGIAKLVMYHFNSPPPTNMIDPTINHIDGNILNNHYTNLEWMERSVNSAIRINKGSGTQNHEAKLTNEQVKEICELLITTELTLGEIGKMYNVNKSTLSRIQRQKGWKEITQNYDFSCRATIRNEKGQFAIYNTNCHGSTGTK